MPQASRPGDGGEVISLMQYPGEGKLRRRVFAFCRHLLQALHSVQPRGQCILLESRQ